MDHECGDTQFHCTTHILSQIPVEKFPFRTIVLYEDVPLISFAPVNESGYFITENELLIFPQGLSYAEVAIPERFRSCFLVSPHARSTFARLGIDVSLGQRETQRLLLSHPLPSSLSVMITNHGDYPVLMRIGDTITLANTEEIGALLSPFLADTSDRLDHFIPLRAYGEHLEIIKKNLPKIKMRNGSFVPFIDPRHPRLLDHTKVIPFRTLTVKAGDFLVLSAKLYPRITKNHIGIIHNAKHGLIHGSSVLIYPGFDGRKLALEFIAYTNMIIQSQEQIALLTIHASPNPLEPYDGRYQNQKTIQPL